MIELKDVSFSYKSGDREGGLKNIDLRIRPGEVVLLCGESGCGKTTLTRLINGLIPHYYEGELTGAVWVCAQQIHQQPLYETAKYVGSVFQNPRSQFFNIDTASEIVFGCENQGLPEGYIRRRLEETASDFQIKHLLGRNLFELSGGEKQKIACASAGAGEAQILVLDEPSANLDTKATQGLRDVISRWKAEGKTIVIAEHRLYYLRHLADRVLYMKKGEICREYGMEELAALGEDVLSKMGLRPLDFGQLPLCPAGDTGAGQALTLEGFAHSYQNTGSGLEVPALEVPAQGITALIGHNGAGKTTLARAMTGLLKKSKGALRRDGRVFTKPKERLGQIYMVLQDVNHQLFTESVLDEVLLSMQDPDEAAADGILASLDLLHLREAHPMSLSGGQKQRVAIAGAIASGRSVIVFDEPTSGLDFRHMQEVAKLLKKLRQDGKTVIVITHDLELICSCCDYVVQMEQGRVTDSYPLRRDTKSRLTEFFFPGQGSAHSGAAVRQ